MEDIEPEIAPVDPEVDQVVVRMLGMHIRPRFIIIREIEISAIIDGCTYRETEGKGDGDGLLEREICFNV